MMAASYVIAAILLLGGTLLCTGIAVGLLLAFKALDRGPEGR